jgi:hypothetical protein
MLVEIREERPGDVAAIEHPPCAPHHLINPFVEKSVFSGQYWIDKCAEAFYLSH